MKSRKLFSKMSVAALLTLALLVLMATAFARHAPPEAKSSNAPSSGGAALGTGVFSLLPGQRMRVSAVNVGGKEIPLQFYLITVTEQGKIAGLVACPNVPVSPGDAAIDTFTNTDETRMLMYVQVRVREDPNDINELVPSVEITDGTSNLTIGLLSGGDFTAIRPIWVP